LINALISLEKNAQPIPPAPTENVMEKQKIDLPSGNDNQQEKIARLQELFKKLNSQGATDIISTYQTAIGLKGNAKTSTELVYLTTILKASKARMIALIAESNEEAERQLLTDKFRVVVDEWWFAKELWDRWENEKRAKASREFWDKILSFFNRKK